MMPILKENELICPCGCGVVLDNIHDSPNHSEKKTTFNSMLLGNTLETDIKYKWNADREIKAKEQAFNFLLNFCKEFALPEEFGHQVYRVMLKKNRGFFSKDNSIAINFMIKILSKDDNYIYINKRKAIEKKYESIINR